MHLFILIYKIAVKMQPNTSLQQDT